MVDGCNICFYLRYALLKLKIITVTNYFVGKNINIFNKKKKYFLIFYSDLG